MSQHHKPSRSIAGIAGIVAVATLISKVFGLVRQQVIAAAFGIGAVADAYNYAYVIPGFLLILLGGINGPFHSAIVSVLAKQNDKAKSARLVETITTLIGGILILVSVIVFFNASFCIDIIAPSLTPNVREIAIEQLKIMSPIALLAGLIGIGFGTLNAADMYWLPSISPLLSSITVIIGVGMLAIQLGTQISLPKYAILGGQILAWGTLAGALLQWLVQLIAQWKAGLGKLTLRFDFKQEGVSDVLKVMGPATLSSGMLQINLYTDLFFASTIVGAAAAMNYSNLLIQTPLGIISNVILVPLLPIFSRLADPLYWGDLKIRIRQGLILSAITMLPLSALMITLSIPIVRVVYERYSFNLAASQLVSSVLIASSLGMFVYLGRDVLVRVFYALGDGETPFKISIVNIFLNGVLDWILVQRFGAPGLVLATVGVNFTSMIALLWVLNRKLGGLPLREWGRPLIGLIVSSLMCGFSSYGTLVALDRVLGNKGLLILILQILLPSAVGLGVFYILATQLKLPEVDLFVAKMKDKFSRNR